MRKRCVAGLALAGGLLLPGCGEDHRARLGPFTTATVVSTDPAKKLVLFDPEESSRWAAGYVVDGARVVVLRDDRGPDGPGRKVAIQVKGRDLRMLAALRAAEPEEEVPVRVSRLDLRADR